MDNQRQQTGPAVAAPQRLEQKYSELFTPQPGALRHGGRFEVFTLTDYSIQVRMSDSTGELSR